MEWHKFESKFPEKLCSYFFKQQLKPLQLLRALQVNIELVFKSRYPCAF